MHTLIIGGSIGGLCFAQGLRKAGIDATVFERSSSSLGSLAGYGIHIDCHGRQALRSCLQPDDWARIEQLSTAAGTHLSFRDTDLQLLAERDDPLLSRKSIADIEQWKWKNRVAGHSSLRSDV